MSDGRPRTHSDELFSLIESSPWMVARLSSVSQAELPDAWIGAGVIRNLVWDTRFRGEFDPSLVRDVDVTYFDPGDLSRERDNAAELRLREIDPDINWDAKNQAAVHTWYPDRFGISVQPYHSIDEAVASWPETATCVAIRRSSAGVLEVIAPHGLDDLMDGVWRRNPARVTVPESTLRLRRQDPENRWPGVRVYRPDSPQ